ncbi:hypothetical protein JCM16358_01060 [Halanaerocella petrolearia]
MTKVKELSREQLEEQEYLGSQASSQTSGVAQKKQEDQDSEVDIINLYQIPDKYGINKLALQVKNPTTSYLYWDYSFDQLNKVAYKAGYEDVNQADLVLRVYDLTVDNSHDLDITLDVNDWYLNDLEPGHTYQVKLGILDNEGNFHSFLTSNKSSQPRNSVSNITDTRWMTVGKKQKQIYLLSGLGSTDNYSSVELAEELKEIGLESLSEIADDYSSAELFVGSSDLAGSSEIYS